MKQLLVFSFCYSLGQQTEQFECNVGGGERRCAGRIEGRRDFDNVRSDKIQVPQPAQHSNDLSRREASDFGSSCAGREGWVQRIDVKTDVGWPLANRTARFPNYRVYPHVFKFLDRYHSNSLLERPVAFVSGVSRASNSNLHHSLG